MADETGNLGEEAQAAQDAFELKQNGLLSKLDKALERRRGKLRVLDRALEECANEERLRKYGELLKANLSILKRGMKSVKVADYYEGEGEEIVIELAADKTPIKNMEAYFRRARKLRKGKPRIETEIELTKGEADWFEDLRNRAESAKDEESLRIVSVEADKALAPKKPKKMKARPGKKLGPKHFVSSDGFDILVGRNQRQNDRLTLTIARGNDIFMHSSGAAGSHIIIRMEKDKEAPRRTMVEAANLALYYSKLRNSRYAEVSWTRVKNVSKPRGAKPGLVYLSKHKTLGIEPDEDLIKMMHENAKEL